MPKGNQKINRTIAKVVIDGKIAQDLPVMIFNGRMLPLFPVMASSWFLPYTGYAQTLAAKNIIRTQ